MEIDGFNEFLNLLCITKKVHDIKRYDLLENSFYDRWDYDDYYQTMYNLFENLFGYWSLDYYERGNFELQIFSDAVIENFYIMAGEYGTLCGITEEDNPYIKQALDMIKDELYIGHCMSWTLKAYTKPLRKYHSRLGIFISHDCGCVELGVLAYRLIEIYEWFEQQCEELKNKLAALKTLPHMLHHDVLISTERQAIAA